MLQLAPLDPRTTILEQLSADADGPVVLVNLFTAAPGDAPALMQAWAEDAAWFNRQPGFISAQLHQTVGGGAAFLNYAIWESLAKFRDAFGKPEFREKLANYPDSVVAKPHLFQKVHVADICEA